MNAMLSIGEVKGTVLDFDDTVFDNGNEPGVYGNNMHSKSRLAAVHAVGASYGEKRLLEITAEQNVQAFLRSPVHTLEGGIWQVLLTAGIVMGDLDPSHELVRKIVEHKDTLYIELVQTEGRLVPGADKFVRALDRRGIPMAIGSTAPRKIIDLVFGITGLNEFIPGERIVSIEKLTHPKPHPQAFDLAYRTLGLPEDDRGSTLAIDDDPRGIQSARGAALHTYGIATRFFVPELLALPIPPHRAVDSYDAAAEMLGFSLDTD